MPDRDDFSAVKDSVVMGDVNQNISIPQRDSFDNLIEKIISCQDSKLRLEIFNDNEFEILKGITEIINLVGVNWADLKDCNFEYFVYEIFESELRKSTLGTTLHKLAVEKDLKDMLYLWHITGLSHNTFVSAKELLRYVYEMGKKHPTEDRYRYFLDSWWWDGEDRKLTLETIFSKLNINQIKQIYEKIRGRKLWHFNEYIICFLYSSTQIDAEYRKYLATDLIKMLDQQGYHLLCTGDKYNPFYAEYNDGSIIIGLTKMAHEITMNDIYLQFHPTYIATIQNWIDQYYKFRTDSEYLNQLVVPNIESEIFQFLLDKKHMLPSHN